MAPLPGWFQIFFVNPMLLARSRIIPNPNCQGGPKLKTHSITAIY